MNFLKAVFNFFVGDWIILGGVLFSFVVVLVAVSSLNEIGGLFLIAGIILTLGLSLYRETHH